MIDDSSPDGVYGFPQVFPTREVRVITAFRHARLTSPSLCAHSLDALLKQSFESLTNPRFSVAVRLLQSSSTRL